MSEQHEHTNSCWWDLFGARWICPAAERPLVDVRDMIVVHNAMLREFRLAPGAVLRVAAGDRKQAGAVAGHVGFICDLLHHHHAGEDELLWPKLRARTPAGQLIDDVEAQHHDLDDALGQVATLLQTWQSEPAVVHRDQLAAQLEKLHTLLSDHLELEERMLLPLAAVVLTDEEWHAIGGAAVASMPKSALALSFGMFAYEGDPAVLVDMLSAAPLLPRKLLPKIAPRLYARRARRVYGTPTP